MGSVGSVQCEGVDVESALKIAYRTLRKWRGNRQYDEMESEGLVTIALLYNKGVRVTEPLIVTAISRMCYRVSQDCVIKMHYRTRLKLGLVRIPVQETAVIQTHPLEWQELTERVDEESILHYWFQGYTDPEIGLFIHRSGSYVQKKRNILIQRLWSLYKDA